VTIEAVATHDCLSPCIDRQAFKQLGLWLNCFDSAEWSRYDRRDSNETGYRDGQKNPNCFQYARGSSVNDKLRFHGRVESAEVREVALLLRFEGPA
jgi:hypothetical protein